MADWSVQFRNGVWLPQAGWWLDAHFPAPRSFVSHAHFDHLAAHGEILCSEVTARLLRARLPGAAVPRTLPFGETAPLGAGLSITLHPAGHIFGSAQCLIEDERLGRLLYTGDFKLRPGLSAERCATPRADVLVMETTYGKPHYVFPPTDEVLADIARFCASAIDDGETPVLFGYSLGKSQEVLSGLARAGLPVMLHPQPLRLTRIYSELGVVFPEHRAFDERELAGHVVICPPQSPQSAFLRKIPRPRTATLTGWALDPGTRFRSGTDAAFPLSDHADFPDLLRFVECVQPRRVFTLHGFAAEFARVLRERGIEAWSVTGDNQLEMPLGLANAGPSLSPTRSAGSGGAAGDPAPPDHPDVLAAESSASETAPDAFARFAAVAEGLRLSSGRADKVNRLAAYLRSLAPEDAARAALYFTGRPFARTDPRTLQLGWSALRLAVIAASGLTRDDFRRAYERTREGGEAAEVLLSGRTRPGPCPLRSVEALLADLAGDRGGLAKLDRLAERLRSLSPVEAKYLVKIITGDLRIGLKDGLVEEALALAADVPAERLREALMLGGDLLAVARAAFSGTLGTIALRVFSPVGFMLASPEPTAAALLARLPAPVWLEEKYDGIRCQLHRLGDRVELYSRDLHRITDQFPDLAAAARLLPSDAILDGELLAWRDGRALPFAELQKRLGRRGDDFFLGAEIPVSLSCYDLLWIDGEAVFDRPLAARRARLERLLAAPPEGNAVAITLAPVRFAADAAEVEAAFIAARARGNEGLLAKDPISPYTPGRRGFAWIKLKKAFATLDVVVVGVEYGHGRRRDVLSDYTFAVRDPAGDRLLPVGKAYSGLTDAEIARLTRHFLDNTLEVRGRVRRVVPDVVLEVAFDSIHPSPRHDSGYALRFPRIVRIRTDKMPAEIDTVETCRTLASAGPFAPAPDGA